MYLSKLTLDASHPQSRRDLGNAYDMHRTLARAFAPAADASPSRFLWRLESGTSYRPFCVVLVQSTLPADWGVIESMSGYAIEILGNKAVDLAQLIHAGRRYRFRLLANPTVTRAGKRYGLLREEEQLAWLVRQGERYGFKVLGGLRGASERLYLRKSRTADRITLDTALFEGVLEAVVPDLLRQAILLGLGHAKAFGLGMLSLARLPD